MAAEPVDADDHREERVVEGVAADDGDQLPLVLGQPKGYVFETHVAPAPDVVAHHDAAVGDVVRVGPVQ